MPLAPRYTWSETDGEVHIRVEGVALKDQSALLCGDSVVKIAAPPHLLLLDLARDVDPAASRATAQGGALHLALRKVRGKGGTGRCALHAACAAVQSRCFTQRAAAPSPPTQPPIYRKSPGRGGP